MTKTAEWTAERLDALPEFTVVEVVADDGDPPSLWLRMADGWWEIEPGVVSWLHSRTILRMGSICAVSVPVGALLSDETVRASAWNLGDHGASRLLARSTLQAAVAHVTGESA